MKLGSVQYLRGLAAAAVVLYHGVTVMNAESSWHILDIGMYGVDLFFVLSGFIITVTTQRITSSALFAVKRIERIVPLYWMTITITAGFSAAIPQAFHSTAIDSNRLILSFLFIPHYHAVVQHEIWPVVVQGWTLSYEMFFYSLFAACIALNHARRALIILCIIFMLVLIGLLSKPTGAIAVVYTNPMLLEFAFGVLIGLAYLQSDHAILRYASFSLLSVASMLLILLVLGIDVARPIVAGGVSAAILSNALLAERVGVKFESHLPLLLGDASYAVYLFHTFPLGGVRYLGGHLGLEWTDPFIDAATLAGGTVLALAIGVWVHVRVEVPLGRAMHRRLRLVRQLART